MVSERVFLAFGAILSVLWAGAAFLAHRWGRACGRLNSANPPVLGLTTDQVAAYLEAKAAALHDGAVARKLELQACAIEIRAGGIEAWRDAARAAKP
jgi:hypothetical protein